MSAFGNQNQVLVPTPTGRIDSEFPDGNDGSQNVFVWADVSAISTQLLAMQVGSQLSLDLSPYYTDPGSPTAQLGFYVVSGTDPRKAGFSFSGTLLVNAATKVNTGTFRLVAVRGEVSKLSAPISYSIQPAQAATDTIAPTIPTGIAAAAGSAVGTISLSFDPPTDIAPPNAAASGSAFVEILANGTVVSPSPVVVPSNALNSPVAVNLGSITNPDQPVFFQDNKNWTMSAAGTGIAGTAAEQCLLVDFGTQTGYQRFVGQLNLFSSSAPNALLGLMVHETNVQGGKFLAVGLRPSNGTVGLYVQSRVTNGAVSSQVATQLKDKNGQNITGPVYVKIERLADGQTLQVAYSLDTNNWIAITTQTIAMVSAVHYDLFSTSQLVGTDVVGTISEVSLNNDPQITRTISSASSVSIQLRSVDAGGNVSTLSSTLVGIPKPPSSQLITWNPGVRVMVGSPFEFHGLKDAFDQMTIIVNKDPGNKVLGFEICFSWSQLENPNQQGDYSGSWAAVDATTGIRNGGLAAVNALIAHAKAFAFPRDISIQVNCSGNGNTTGSTTYPSSFAPNWLNSTTYGSINGNSHGGCYYAPSSASQPPGPLIQFWKAPVAQKMIALAAAYNGLGIYRWDPIMEISVNGATTWTDSEAITTFGILAQGLRAAMPTTLILLRPTYAFRDRNSYPAFMAAVMPWKISIGNYDNVYEPQGNGDPIIGRRFWGDMAFRGLMDFGGSTVPPARPQTGGPNNGPWFDYQAAGYDFHTWQSPDTLGPRAGGSNPLPATYGRGFLPDIYNHIVQMKASHSYWISNQQAGPNCNRTVFTSGAPANPTPPNGPGGGVASTPLLQDYFQTFVIPNTSYPAAWLSL